MKPSLAQSGIRTGREALGFTMVEALITTALAGIILAGVLTSYIMITRGFNALSNYWEIHSEGRYAIDRFSADMRGVSQITTYGGTNGPLAVAIPTAFSSSGIPTTTKTVTYSFSGGKLLRTDSATGVTKPLATHVYLLRFYLYDRIGSNTTVAANAKGVQVELFLRKYTGSQAQTEDYLSARLNMRNKP